MGGLLYRVEHIAHLRIGLGWNGRVCGGSGQGVEEGELENIWICNFLSNHNNKENKVDMVMCFLQSYRNPKTEVCSRDLGIAIKGIAMPL